MSQNWQYYLSDINMSFRSISGMGLNDILDVAIIAYLVYKLFIWIKETQTWSLLKGFGIILAISILSYMLSLHAAWWIIERTFNVGLIALFILFQPEIRKALEQIGNSSFSISDRNNVDESKKAIDEIMKAVENMAAVRTGALILIEHNIRLRDLSLTGIPIDAVVTSQLLENIFEDKTPLHDGAVIISRNRIVAACCILPLTKAEIGKELGTRHRAAVGVSESYDAIVLVVSEESGRISVAQSGKLRRRLSVQQIRSILEANVLPEEKMKLSQKFSKETFLSWWKGLKKNGKNI